jgi:cytochrome b561/polyisoprenoid-binding protein YceI
MHISLRARGRHGTARAGRSALHRLSMIRNTQDSWGSPAKFFHWATAVLVFVQFALGWMAVSWRLSPTKAHLYVWHKSVGMLLLALVVMRLMWRLTNRSPAFPADMPQWQRHCARASYVLLYAVLIAMPLTGWILNSAANVPVHLFWLIPLPTITSPSRSTAALAALAHLTAFVLLTALLAVHIVAALRHHFTSRNDVLLRMLPGTRAPVARAAPVIVMLLLVGVPRPAQAAQWSMDRAGSRLEFLVTFESAPATGVFHEFDTRVHLQPDRPHESRIDVKIATVSADMMSPGFNTAIRAREWFDSGQFPYAEFHSTEVRRTGVDRYLAKGTLLLKGVARAVEVPFVFSEAALHAALRGELTVRRADFRIGTGEWAASEVVGPEVKVRFAVQLRRSDR